MDSGNILNAFVASAKQLVLNQTELNILHMQRHLEIVSGLTAESDVELFDCRNTVVIECITHLVNILMDNIKLSLVPRVLTVLQNLGKNNVIKKSLQTTFNVHSAISIFLQNYGMLEKDPIVLQCFELLETITHNVSIDYVGSHFENLINFLLKQVDDSSSELFIPSLHVISNICRHNSKVQAYICSLSNVKEIYKSFASKLSNQTPKVTVYALSILTSLTSQNRVGEKLWATEHLTKTFELIVGLLLSNDQSCAKAALNLFLDLMENEKCRSYFLHTDRLQIYLQKISKVLKEENKSGCFALYLQFLLEFACIPESNSKVISVICSETSSNEGDVNTYQMLSIHPTIVKLCSENFNASNESSKIALDLIRCVVEFYMEDNFDAIEQCLKNLLQDVLNKMQCSGSTGSMLQKKQFDLLIALIDLLLLVCKKLRFKTFISKSLNIQFFEEIAMFHLENNSLANEDNEWDDCEIDLFLKTVEMVAIMKDTLDGATAFLDTILGDVRAVPFLTHAITSKNTRKIKTGFLLISLSFANCPQDVLVDNISARISNIQQMSRISCIDGLTSGCCPKITSSKTAVKKTDESTDNMVDSLISKIESDFNIKELKSSEIMDLYEHKIAMLSLKEQELQSLVQVKTAALQEADRVLSQYKCRQAQVDAEALKIRNILKESERRSEIAIMNCNQALHKAKQLEAEMEISHQQKNSLEAEIENMEVHAEQLKCQIESIEEEKEKALEMISSLEEDKCQVEEQLKCCEKQLKESEETIKQITKNLSAKTSELESEREKSMKQLKEKEEKIQELNKQISKLNETLKQRNEAYKKLEENNKSLEENIENDTKQITKLKKDVAFYELVCKQHETSIKEKDDKLKSLAADLEKHKHIATMIHEMTSGGIKKS